MRDVGNWDVTKSSLVSFQRWFYKNDNFFEQFFVQCIDFSADLISNCKKTVKTSKKLYLVTKYKYTLVNSIRKDIFVPIKICY